MFKKNLYRVCFGLAALATLGATTVLFAQDDDATKAKRPLSVRSIRPFQRSEKSTSQAPNLYDKKSDEFDYFREELGRSETSTKTKKRLQEIESRVTYADPMDKPAYDGSKFINIYDDVYVDGEPFEDPTDPDVAYSADENNILAIAAAAPDISAQANIPLSCFMPSRCDHPLCGFHASFLIDHKGGLKALSSISHSSTVRGCERDNREYVARNWRRAPDEHAPSAGFSDEMDFDTFLYRLRHESITLSAMAFQDAMNLNIERLHRCSLHVYDRGKIKPFCAKYLTPFS